MIYNCQFQYHWARFIRTTALSVISLIGLKTKAAPECPCCPRITGDGSFLVLGPELTRSLVAPGQGGTRTSQT